MKPRLAMCNLFSDAEKLRDFALKHGFSGIDWSFDVRSLPDTPAEESKWVKRLSILGPLEIRYHCPFYRIDLGHRDPWEAKVAEAIFRRIICLVSKVRGKYLTMHVGLGRDSTEPLSWDRTIENLRSLVQHGANHGIKICLENLSWGWTSRPHLFEKLIRKSGAGTTFDIGHAHACESIKTRQYAVEDFVIPHADRVFNAHVYHTELPNRGHMPPDRLEDVEDRLALVEDVGCRWWVLEVWEVGALLQTKKIVDEYLTRTEYSGRCDHQAPRQALHPGVDPYALFRRRVTFSF